MIRERQSRCLRVTAILVVISVVMAGCATASDGPTDRPASDGDDPAQLGINGDFEIIAKGRNAAVRLPVQTVVTERETWIDAWAALTANESPAPERPEVSFADSTVVIVVLGERPTGGYSVGISSVLYSEDQAIVEVSVGRPADDAMVGQVLTTPFVIARLNGTELEITFTGDDVFEEFAL